MKKVRLYKRNLIIWLMIPLTLTNHCYKIFITITTNLINTNCHHFNIIHKGAWVVEWLGSYSAKTNVAYVIVAERVCAPLCTITKRGALDLYVIMFTSYLSYVDGSLQLHPPLKLVVTI